MRDQQPRNNEKLDPLNEHLRDAIRHMVANISKSFIVEWYTSISPTNHDFVVCCEALIENALTKLAELSVEKVDKYKIGQLVAGLLHEHVLNENTTEKIQSIEHQIDNYEYDICQNSVVRLFGLLCTDELRQVIFTKLSTPRPTHSPSNSKFNQELDPYSMSTTQSSSRSSTATRSQHENGQHPDPNQAEITQTTSALYTLVIAMLTKAVFMPIIESISNPQWLYAVIIWLCKKEERDQARRLAESRSERDQAASSGTGDSCSVIGRQFNEACKLDNLAKQNPSTSIIVTNSRGYRSLDLEEGIDIASANINFDNPICDSLKRPLDNIEIYATEEVKSTNSCYILYCIRYDGLCHRHPSAGFSFIPENPDIPVIDKRASNVTRRRLVLHESTSSTATTSITSRMQYPEAPNRKYFRRKMTIKRRFREFVLLQLRLEENPKIRPYMKNIPKPTKLKAATQNIFSLPGITNIKLDQSTIKLRQRFLERFLVALNSSPFIANSFEFKEFFSYNVNTANISKSKSLILQVNLNKVFVDSVRSALSIIRSSLPDVRKAGENINLGSNPDPDAWLAELQQSTLKLHVQTRTSHTKTNLERMIDSKLLSMNNRSNFSEQRRQLFGQQQNKSFSLDRYSKNQFYTNQQFAAGDSSRNGSLRAHMVKRVPSSNPLSRSSSSNSRNTNSSSRSSSTESLYFDASSHLDEETDNGSTKASECNSIQICDTFPIASKIIDMIHYSISKDPMCSNSAINFMARFALGRMIERYATRLLDAAFTLETATFCINGITSSIWDESDGPPLDLENANLEEATIHLTKIIQGTCTNTFIPKQLLASLISGQLRFYLSQLSSQKRNKFAIYSYFVHLLDELEAEQ